MPEKAPADDNENLAPMAVPFETPETVPGAVTHADRLPCFVGYITHNLSSTVL